MTRDSPFAVIAFAGHRGLFASVGAASYATRLAAVAAAREEASRNPGRVHAVVRLVNVLRADAVPVAEVTVEAIDP